jgi:hypothetical protein
MCAPSPPAVQTVDPAAQGAANKDAAISTAKINNPNIYNPYGTQTVTYGPDGKQDELTPTLRQTFSPEQQVLYDKSIAAKTNLGDVSISGSNALKGIIGNNVDLSGAPPTPQSYGALRDSVINASMARVNEDAGRTRDQSNSDLLAAGIRPGTKAYDDRMNLIQRGVNDALNVATVNAGNQATQAFGTDSQRRKDAIAEILTQRQTPLNEVTALLSNSQVSNPFAGGLGYQAGSQVQPVNLAGIADANNNANIGAYNAQQGSSNAQLGGLFQLGAAGIKAYSDRRLKSKIVRIGTHPLGIGIYEYDIFGKRDIGVMADEVEKVAPHAVTMQPNGFKMVDYGSL